MFSLRSAVISGAIATFIASVILVMKNALGKFPDVHIPQTLSNIIGAPHEVFAGGVLFVIIGVVVLSSIYAYLSPRLRFDSVPVKGLLYGFVIWLAMMLIMMPIAGAGV